MSDEVTFLQQGNATVTSARIMLNGTTYALRNVTSVQMRSRGPKLLWPVLIALVSFVVGLLAVGNSNWELLMYAAIVCVICIFVVLKSRSTYIVAMATSAGEVNALQSQDKAVIENIVGAINQAIVHKG